MSDIGRVRALERRDLPELVALCREHVRYERASWAEYERERKLEALFLDPGGARCWVVDGSDELAGFASANLELSTWDAGHYLHLDCLYLRAAYRGRGWGRTLVEHVTRVALELGAVNVQWQTPTWNEGAVRFYERLGAGAAEKLRFTLSLDACSRLLGPQTDLDGQVEPRAG